MHPNYRLHRHRLYLQSRLRQGGKHLKHLELRRYHHQRRNCLRFRHHLCRLPQCDWRQQERNLMGVRG